MRGRGRLRAGVKQLRPQPVSRCPMGNPPQPSQPVRQLLRPPLRIEQRALRAQRKRLAHPQELLRAEGHVPALAHDAVGGQDPELAQRQPRPQHLEPGYPPIGAGARAQHSAQIIGSDGSPAAVRRGQHAGGRVGQEPGILIRQQVKPPQPRMDPHGQIRHAQRSRHKLAHRADELLQIPAVEQRVLL